MNLIEIQIGMHLILITHLKYLWIQKMKILFIPDIFSSRNSQIVNPINFRTTKHFQINTTTQQFAEKNIKSIAHRGHSSQEFLDGFSSLLLFTNTQKFLWKFFLKIKQSRERILALGGVKKPNSSFFVWNVSSGVRCTLKSAYQCNRRVDFLRIG